MTLTMKTIKLFTTVALLAIAMSCSEDIANENVVPSQDAADRFSLDVYCSFEPDAATRVEMTETTEGIEVAWQEGDTFTLQHTKEGSEGWQSAIQGEPVITFEYSGVDNKFVIAESSDGDATDLIAGYDYRVVCKNKRGKMSAEMRKYSYTQEGNSCAYIGDLYATNFVVSWTEETTSIKFSHVMSMTKVNFKIPNADHTPKTIVWRDKILSYNHEYTGTFSNPVKNSDDSYSTYFVYPSFNVTDGSRNANVAVTCNEADAPEYEWAIFNNSSENKAGVCYTANITLAVPFKATEAVELADETILLTLNDDINSDDIASLEEGLSVKVVGASTIEISSVEATDDAKVLAITLSDPIYGDDDITLSYAVNADKPIRNADNSLTMCEWSTTVTMNSANEVLTSDVSFAFEGNDELWKATAENVFEIVADPVDPTNRVAKLNCPSSVISIYNGIALNFESNVKYHVSYDLYIPEGTKSADGYMYFSTSNDGKNISGGNKYPAWTGSSKTKERNKWITLSREQSTISSYAGVLYAYPYFNDKWSGDVYLDNIVVEKIGVDTRP